MKQQKATSKRPALDELVLGALSQLQILHYNERSIRRYQSTWNRLIRFAQQNHFENTLSEKLIAQFLEHYGIQPKELIRKKAGWRKHAEFSLKTLWQFSRYGYFERIHTLIQKLNVPPVMKKALNEYVTYCKEKRYFSTYGTNEKIRQLTLFLDFIAKKGVKTFEQIQHQHLSGFICTLWRFSPKTISRVVSDIRQFLRYLFLRNRLTQDKSQMLPVIHVTHHDTIPSVWDKELIMKLLSVVDRSSPRGKRDYAILLLAYRLGLRVGDIRELTLDQINWEAETISLIQSKTQRLLVLPLSNEMGNALIDYIQFGRPKTNFRQVFLRLNPPFIPFGNNNHLYDVMKHWKEIADIHFRTKQHQGLHSLRHSLATYLLEEDTSFPIISSILGHESTMSTMIYAKSSVEALRQVALSLKEVDHVKP